MTDDPQTPPSSQPSEPVGPTGPTGPTGPRGSADLDRLWSQVPVGPLPLEAIRRRALRDQAARDHQEGVRRAAAGATPRRRPDLRRRLALVGVAAAIGGAFVAGTLVDPSGLDGPGGAVADNLVPAAFHGELQAPADCEELVASYVERAVAMVGPDGWLRPGESSSRAALTRLDSTSADLLAVPDAANLALSEGFAARTPRTESATSSATGTNVQEAGVDEPDLVKTDGETLVRLKDDRLTTYDVSGPAIQQLGRLDLDGFADGEILLAGDTVVAVGNDGRDVQTRVLTVDLSDPAAPTLEHTTDYDTTLLAARQHGGSVRLALSAGLPRLDFVAPDGDRTSEEARAANVQVVRDSTAEDWLPRIRRDGGETEQLLDCADVAIPRAGLGLDTTAVVGFAAASPGEVQGIGLAGAAPLVYASADHLYLTASGVASNGFCFDFCDVVRIGSGGDDDARAEDLGTSYVYDFALDGAGATYVGAGEVEGAVADRWAMDEKDGVLRVAVGPTTETGDFNSVVTLEPREVGGETELAEVGRLDAIGVGEDIKSVRWFDDLALVVTFRRIDPFYAIDLSRPEAPRLLGELELPGFSSYLHPLGERRVLGIGEGPGPRGYGAQAGLFDVTDLAAPTRIDAISYGRGTTALAGLDPRQFTWLPEQRTALTVVDQSRTRTGYVSVIGLGGGTLANEMVQVEYGDDVDQVRLVPLPSGRVALVTGESVRYFPL